MASAMKERNLKQLNCECTWEAKGLYDNCSEGKKLKWHVKSKEKANMIPEFVKPNLNIVPRLVKTNWQYIYIGDACILIKSMGKMAVIAASLGCSLYKQCMCACWWKLLDGKLAIHFIYKGNKLWKKIQSTLC